MAARALPLAAAAGDPPVAFAEEGVGTGGEEAAISPRMPPSQGLPLSCLPPRVVFCPDWRVWGAFLRPGDQPGGGAEDGHVQSDLGDDGLGRPMTPQPVISSSRATAGSTGAPGPVPACGPVLPSASMPQAAGIAAISSPDPGVQPSRSGPSSPSIRSSSIPGQLAGWSSNRPVSASISSGVPFFRSDLRASPGQRPGVALAGDQRLDHRPAPRAVQLPTSHREILISARSSSFSIRCPVPGPLAVPARRAAG